MRQILILFLLTVQGMLSAQELRVPLESKQGRSYLSSEIWSIVEIKDVSKYTMPDTNSFSSWKLGVAIFNYAQYKMENERSKRLEQDTAYLTKKGRPRNLLSVFTGDNGAGERIVIVDENRNFDLSDDTVYRIKRDNPRAISKTLTFDVYKGSELLSFPVFLQINPYSNISINGKPLMVDIYSQDYLEGILDHEKRKFLIQLNDREQFSGVSGRGRVQLKILELPVDSGGRYFTRSYKLSDSIPVGSGLYVVALEDKMLRLNKIGYIENEKSIPVFKEKDLLTSTVLKNETFKGKYTLIDFWGSWCGPCIQSLPHLVGIHKKYGDKLNMLSVANDQPKDVEKLKGLIAKHKLTWNHIWSDRSEKWSESLPFRFGVSAFPTLVILDPETNEVKRFTGSDKLDSLDQFLELILENSKSL